MFCTFVGYNQPGILQCDVMTVESLQEDISGIRIQKSNDMLVQLKC
jgi:hypothetical protein